MKHGVVDRTVGTKLYLPTRIFSNYTLISIILNTDRGCHGKVTLFIANTHISMLYY